MSLSDVSFTHNVLISSIHSFTHIIILQITQISIRWLMIINTVVPAEALTHTAVDYDEFLRSYKLVSTNDHNDFEDIKIIDDLYGQRKKLESLFCFFDTDGNGVWWWWWWWWWFWWWNDNSDDSGNDDYAYDDYYDDKDDADDNTDNRDDDDYTKSLTITYID